jgi:hypothetical protein
MIAAVREWCEKKADHPAVKKNLPGLVRLRPDGFPRIVAGMPVIT